MTTFSEVWGQRFSGWKNRDPWPSLFLLSAGIASVVILAVLAVVVWLSFRSGAPGDPAALYTFANYVATLHQPFTYQILANTFGFSFVTLIVALAFGLPTAWLAERTDLPGKNALFTLMAIGLLIPGFATAMGWLFLLNPRIGLLNAWLRDSFGLVEAPFNIATVIGMGWVQGLNLAPVAFIMTAAVFRAADPTLEEAAQMSGANFRQVVRRIGVPLAWPGVLAAGIYIFTIGFAAFDVPAIIGWSNRLFTFSTYLVLQINPVNELPNYGMVAALSAILITLAGFFSWWYGRMQARAHRYQVVRGKAYRPNRYRLGRGKYGAWAYLGFYLCAAKLMPILLLAWAAALPFLQLPSAAALEAASLARFFRLPWPLITEGVINTGALMILTPTVTVVLSLAFSWIVLRSRVPGRRWFDFVAFLPHSVPSIVFGVGVLLITLYVVEAVVPVWGTLWILLAVFVIARTSYGTRMTNSGLIQIHRELEESGQMSGASTGGVLRRIIAPLLAPTMLNAWLWIALLTFRELTLAVILTTRDNITLPVIIWNLWLGGGLGDAAALALLLLLAMVPIIALYWFAARRHGLAADA